MESLSHLRILIDTLNLFEISYIIADSNLFIKYLIFKNLPDVSLKEKFLNKNIKDVIVIYTDNNKEVEFNLVIAKEETFNGRLLGLSQHFIFYYSYIILDESNSVHLFLMSQKENKEEFRYIEIIKFYIDTLTTASNIFNKTIGKIDYEYSFDLLYVYLKKFLRNTTFLINEYNKKEKKFFTKFFYSPYEEVKEIFKQFNNANPFYFTLTDNIYKKKLKPHFVKLDLDDFFEIYTAIPSEKLFEYLTKLPVIEMLSFGFIQENSLIGTVTLFIHSKEEKLLILENFLKQFNLILQRNLFFKNVFEIKNVLSFVLNDVNESILIIDDSYTKVFENKHFISFLEKNFRNSRNSYEKFINDNKLYINKAIKRNTLIEEVIELESGKKYFLVIIPIKESDKTYITIKVKEKEEIVKFPIITDSIFENFSEGLIVTDKELKIILYNSSFLRIFGIKKNVLHEYLFSVIDVKTHNNLLEIFKKLIEKKIVLSKKVIYINENGEEKRLLKIVIPLCGVNTYFLIIFSELQSNGQSEPDGYLLKDYQLKMLPFIVNRLKIELNKFFDSINTFDLNSLKKCFNFYKYLNSLHFLLTIDDQKKKTKNIVFVYNVVSEEIEHFLKNVQINSEVVFSFENTINENYPVIVNEFVLREIIKILLENSLTRTKKGIIRLKYTLGDEFLNLYLSDTGSHINYNEFNLSVESDKINKVLINDEIIDFFNIEVLLKPLGGTLKIENSLNYNSVIISIPIRQIEKIVNEKVHEVEKHRIDLHNIKILICEDDEFNFLFFKEILEGHNAEVHYAKNGNEAIEKIRTQNYDLVLMDLRLPDIDGLTVIKKIKEISPMVPIIIQTAYNISFDKEEMLAEDVIYKPIDYNLLLYKMQIVINKK